MLRSLARASLLVCVGLALATACGSDDSKKTRRGDEDTAGMGGEPAMHPSGGGNKNFAGQPAAPEGGGGGGAEPMPVVGGQAGQPPVVTPQGGMGGQPGNEPVAGAGGMTLTSAGAGGTPPDVACCQPKTCDEAFPPADLKWGSISDDGCGHYGIFCGCPAGTQAQGEGSGDCVACQVDAEFCMSHCGDTVDNCGNPISCADTCFQIEAQCYDGSCCYPSQFCDSPCGQEPDGCGGIIDCANTCDGGDCVNNTCCVRNGEACSTQECGLVWDDCEMVDCGNPCSGTQGCIDNKCQESQCKAGGFNCGQVNNPLAVEGIENCGDCPDYQACVDNVCQPICGVAQPG